MPPLYSKELYPYIVIGDGIIATRKLVESLLMRGKTKNPIPTYQFASSLKKANEIASKMEPWNEQVWVCKVVRVVE
jgi:hypothetical protein